MNVAEKLIAFCRERGIQVDDSASSAEVLLALQNYSVDLDRRISESRAESAKLAEEIRRDKEDAKIEALANTISVLNELKDMKLRHAEALVDFAIIKGKIALHERDARIQRLFEAKDFLAEKAALANESVKYQTTAAYMEKELKANVRNPDTLKFDQ